MSRNGSGDGPGEASGAPPARSAHGVDGSASSRSEADAASGGGAGDPLEMDPETMRRLGYRAVDMLVERIAGLEDEPTWRGESRPSLERRLRESPPAGPASDPGALLDRLADDVLAVAGRIDHPRFFAFIPGCPTWPGILGDFLAAGFNVFQGTWLESAGPSALELIVLDWFKEWIGYPADAAGVLVSGGSAANLDALVCAREASRTPDGGEAGDHDGDAADAAPGIVYLSDQTHSSVERAARIAGYTADRIRTLPTDESYRFRPDALHAAIEEDVRAGRRPVLVVANAGATNTGAVDPLPALADVCRERGVWLHVDAAYGGYAVLSERGRTLLEGIERADSVTLDPHKWLYQPYEAGCLLVRDGRRLDDAFHIMPDYLQDTDTRRHAGNDGGAAWWRGGVNFADRGLQLTRATRAVKIWLSLQTFGVDAFRATIDRCFDLALHAQRRIEDSPTLELLSPARFGIVCFRRRPADTGEVGRSADPTTEERLDRINESLVERLSRSGVGMISSTRLDGRYALRLCILNHRSRVEDVDRVLDWLAAAPIERA
ncbi:MAG: pyridoxal phosphate-dependent decarboxylase family protein [Gemmatimonadota bacterium]